MKPLISAMEYVTKTNKFLSQLNITLSILLEREISKTSRCLLMENIKTDLLNLTLTISMEFMK